MVDIYGIRVKNAAGVTTLDIIDRLSRTLGYITIGGNGGFTVPEAVNGAQIWFNVIDPQAGYYASSNPPIVVKDATTIQWSTPNYGDGVPGRAVNLIYGVY